MRMVVGSLRFIKRTASRQRMFDSPGRLSTASPRMRSTGGCCACAILRDCRPHCLATAPLTAVTGLVFCGASRDRSPAVPPRNHGTILKPARFLCRRNPARGRKDEFDGRFCSGRSVFG
jgi:hypothetical protein